VQQTTEDSKGYLEHEARINRHQAELAQLKKQENQQQDFWWQILRKSRKEYQYNIFYAVE